MTYQFSHYSKQITISLEEAKIKVHTNNKGEETVRRLPYTAIRKIHLSATDPNICRCKIFFNENREALSISCFDIHYKLMRTKPEQFVAYGLFIESLHQKVLAEGGLQRISFVCGNSVKMWFLYSLIGIFLLVSVPMALSLKRYEFLLVPFGSMAVLLFYMRKTGFTRAYNPNVILQFLPVVNV